MSASNGNLKKLQQTIANRVKSLRKAAGLTQEQLAEKAGMGPEYLSRLETAQRIPSLETIVELAAALDVEPVDLLGRLENDAQTERADRITTTLRRVSDAAAAFLEEELLNWIAFIRRKDK
jgi:transcriptional regulator with XRE-family HTH domain